MLNNILFNRTAQAVLTVCLAAGLSFVASGQGTAEDIRIQTVVIDPGHGGKDPGAVGKKSYEKDIALNISLNFGALIKKHYPDVKVIYTRDTDKFVPLHERAEIANRNEADVFISIHINANTNRSAYGTETYVLGYHRYNSKLEVAKKENSVILMEEDYKTTYEGYDPNSTESYIIFQLIQDVYLEQSHEFAGFVQEQFKDHAKRRDRGVFQAGFLVLWRTSMPSILVEAGYISNADEETYLMTEKAQTELAESIFYGFKQFKEKREAQIVNSGQGKKPPKQVETDPGIEKMLDNTGKESSDKVIFMVQVVSSSEPVGKDYFSQRGIDAYKEMAEDGMYKYMIGSETNLDNISKLKKHLRQQFPGAFVVAFHKGEKIPLNQAIQLAQ